MGIISLKKYLWNDKEIGEIGKHFETVVRCSLENEKTISETDVDFQKQSRFRTTNKLYTVSLNSSSIIYGNIDEEQ